MSRTRIDERGVVVGCSGCGQANRLPFERLGAGARCRECGHLLASPAQPVAVQDPAHFDALVRASAVPVLVDFWAAWCGPCHMLTPELEKLAASEAGGLLVAKVDTEAQAGLAARHGIRSLPTLVLFSGGREQARTAGARPAAALSAFVRQAMVQSRSA